MYRAEPSVNHFCTRQQRESNYKKHRDALANIKPSVDTNAPKDFPHLRQNAKKKQQQKERTDQIGKDNRILVDKMTEIMTKNYVDNKNENFKFIGSLNSEKRKRELRKITAENQAILKRIQNRQPNYNHLQWQEDYCKSRKWLGDKGSSGLLYNQMKSTNTSARRISEDDSKVEFLPQEDDIPFEVLEEEEETVEDVFTMNSKDEIEEDKVEEVSKRIENINLDTDNKKLEEKEEIVKEEETPNESSTVVINPTPVETSEIKEEKKEEKKEESQAEPENVATANVEATVIPEVEREEKKEENKEEKTDVPTPETNEKHEEEEGYQTFNAFDDFQE
ncbi:hypothetical protein ABK040_014478 [Willaertia magna]